MNRTELSGIIADNLDVAYTDVDRIIVSLFDVVTDALERGESVRIRGFGTFEARGRRAVTLRHPGSGEPINVPARITVGLRPADPLRRRLNTPRKGAK